jgi:hypothetical protein
MARRCVRPGVHPVRLAAFAAFAASCGGGGKADKPADRPARDCKAQVAELSAFFHAMNHDPMVVWASDDVHLVMRPELPAIDGLEAPIVTLTPAGLRFQDKRPSWTELGPLLVHEKLHLDDEISEHRYPRDLEGKIDSRHAWLVIDAAATWGDVVKLTDMIGKVGFDRPTFVFGKPSPVAPPPRSAIDDELDKIGGADSGNRATALANAITKVIATCPPLTKVFAEIGNREGGDKAQDLLDHSGPAILACDCNLDVAAYRSVIWRTAGNPHPETSLPVTLAASGTAIAQPAATPWADAHKQLQPDTMVHLVAK